MPNQGAAGGTTLRSRAFRRSAAHLFSPSEAHESLCRDHADWSASTWHSAPMGKRKVFAALASKFGQAGLGCLVKTTQLNRLMSLTRTMGRQASGADGAEAGTS